jgi:hypothetical protein
MHRKVEFWRHSMDILYDIWWQATVWQRICDVHDTDGRTLLKKCIRSITRSMWRRSTLVALCPVPVLAFICSIIFFCFCGSPLHQPTIILLRPMLCLVLTTTGLNCVHDLEFILSLFFPFYYCFSKLKCAS